MVETAALRDALEAIAERDSETKGRRPIDPKVAETPPKDPALAGSEEEFLLAVKEKERLSGMSVSNNTPPEQDHADEGLGGQVARLAAERAGERVGVDKKDVGPHTAAVKAKQDPNNRPEELNFNR
ncbi:MAG: hypothetical protein MK052_01805 [Alphaproteobacteria bacterium]|nr:hypothetical protein [Alphaproteobacteria bacterium]